MKCSRCGTEDSTLIEATFLCEECHKPPETWTKRDEIALSFATAWLSSRSHMNQEDMNPAWDAECAYNAAEAFLAEKERRDK